MPTLSERLKALGVKQGAQDLPAPRPRPSPGAALGFENHLPGHAIATPLGETFLIEERYPADYMHGRVCLQCAARMDVLAAWAGEPGILKLALDGFAFLDTETTGLSGGTGTYAFLVGVGRFEGGEFHLAQFMMRDPAEEPALLAAVEQFLAPCNALVTFNGKAFDMPLLNTRFISHGLRPSFSGYAHVDLLHLARRLWRDRLPSRTLMNLEYQILGATRLEDDIPGWDIPHLYFDYLRSGDAGPLRRVVYHNAMDVVSLAALFGHVAAVLDDPLHAGLEHGADVVALARLYEDLGDLDGAASLYLHGLQHDLPRGVLLEAINRLAAIYKRQNNLTSAIALWQEAARYQHLQAHIELAKAYEHRLRDPFQALGWTQSAIDLVRSPAFTPYERRMLLPELEHRLERLVRKQT